MKKVQSKNAKVLCCILTKNAETTVSSLLNILSNEMLEFFDELVIVDNASTDKTVQVCKEALQDRKFQKIIINIFQNSTNYGLGGSHKLIFKYAYDSSYDYVLFIHGDNSTDPNQFHIAFENNFHEFDMILANRFSRLSVRKNYPFHRYLFNKILSATASILFFKRINDFSTGGINLYRVQSFFNKFENPIKYFSNDVSFPQYLLLYSIFKRQRFYFLPVSIEEKDIKAFSRLQSQFLKSLLLLLKFKFTPRKMLGKAYGTYLGYNYRRVKIAGRSSSEVAIPLAMDNSVQDTNVEMVTDENIIVGNSSLVHIDPPSIDFKFTDLKRLSIKDRFVDSFDNISFSIIEATEKASSAFLVVEVELDINNLVGQGLRSFFMRMFKVFSSNKLIVLLKANENILKTKQCLELVEFFNRFKVNIKIISNNPSNLKLWQFYSGKVSGLILNFEQGIIHRSDFFNLSKSLSVSNKVYINIITSEKKFYYCLGLKEKLTKERVGENVMLLRYAADEECAKDHLEIISSQNEKNFNEPNLPLKFTHSYKSRSEYALDVFAGDIGKIKFLKINLLGELILSDEKNKFFLIGSLFTEGKTDLNELFS